MQNRIGTGLPATINYPAEPDTIVFLNEIAPSIPPDLMKKIVCEDYKGDNKEAMSFVNEFAKDSGDTYLIAACLLWKFKIPAEPGAGILARIDDALKAGAAFKIDIVKTSDAQMFFKEVMHLLTVGLLKQIACEAYCNNNEALLPLVKVWGKQTGSRYFKAVLMLWRFNVNADTGRIILDRVDGYCKINRNKLYIDLCVYKDIYGAYKTKNATLVSPIDIGVAGA